MANHHGKRTCVCLYWAVKILVRVVGPSRRPHGGDTSFNILKVYVVMVTFIAEATGQILLIVANQYLPDKIGSGQRQV